MENKTILVIEDNELNMKLVRSLLKIDRYHVLEACDAQTGIELARKQKPDLILMDIQLPGIDGLIATKKIKEDPDLKDIPIIALTAHAMSGDEKKAHDAGCDGYICKPIHTRSFLGIISQFFSRGMDSESHANAASVK